MGGACAGMIKQGWPAVLFEPHPDLHAWLARTYAGNDAVTALQVAVSDEPGEMAFYTSDEHPGIHSLAPFHATHKPTTTVRVVRLADELDRLGVDKVTALKIDVEGADFLALRSFDFRRRRPQLIMVEFMDDRSARHFRYTHHDMARHMAANGYETFVSEWARLLEYGRQDDSQSHRWKRFRHYRHDWRPEPGVWGNLLFVEPADAGKLKRTVARVLVEMQARMLVGAIPGAKPLIRHIEHVVR